MCENLGKMSEGVHVCRVCLATEVKLYDMYQYKLVTAYEIITGSRISTTDSLPNQTCSYCSTLLLKYAAFQERCICAQGLLHEGLMRQNVITTSYIHSIDRETHSLTLPYSIEVYPPLEVKFDTIDEKLDVKAESISDDDRPLSKVNKVPRKRRKRKKSTRNNEIDSLIKIENHNDYVDPIEDFNDDINQVETYKHNSSDIEGDFEVINLIKQESLDTIDTRQKFKFEDSNEAIPLSKIKKKSQKKRTDVEDLQKDNQNDEIYIDDNVEVINLTRQEQIAEILSRKESANYKNSFFKCDVCYKGFITEITFRNHMERHDPRSGDHVCQVCGSRWPSVRTLRAHEQSSHLRRYRCKQCDHVAKSSFKAREHSKWHQGVQYACNVCGATFAKSTSHLTHLRLRHGGAAQCALCGARLLGECGLKAHMRKAHRFQDKQSLLHCPTCQTTFKTPEALQTHSSPTSGESRPCAGYKWCVHCGSGFDSCEELKAHEAQHRQEVACDQCDKTFASARTLSQHRARAHLGGTARARSATAQHCVCEVCGHTCTSKATLVCHLRTHTGEKPYQCSECPKRFSVYQRLQIHIRTHTGESPFKCSCCPKAFKHKAALNRHARVHTGAKPYQCIHCGKAFSQSNSMKGHVRTVHLKMPPPYRNRKRTE